MGTKGRGLYSITQRCLAFSGVGRSGKGIQSVPPRVTDTEMFTCLKFKRRQQNFGPLGAGGGGAQMARLQCPREALTGLPHSFHRLLSIRHCTALPQCEL